MAASIRRKENPWLPGTWLGRNLSGKTRLRSAPASMCQSPVRGCLIRISNYRNSGLEETAPSMEIISNFLEELTSPFFHVRMCFCSRPTCSKVRVRERIVAHICRLLKQLCQALSWWKSCSVLGSACATCVGEVRGQEGSAFDHAFGHHDPTHEEFASAQAAVVSFLVVVSWPRSTRVDGTR